MRRMLVIATLIVAAAAAARPAPAAFVTGCCACLPGEKATTGGPPLPPATHALFCALVTDMGYPEFVSRCEDAGGSDPCVDPEPGQSCAAALAETGIVCPAAPGVPAAGGWGLGALALILPVLGALALRRRAA